MILSPLLEDRLHDEAISKQQGPIPKSISIGPELVQTHWLTNTLLAFVSQRQLRPQLLLKPAIRQDGKVLEVNLLVLVQVSSPVLQWEIARTTGI